MLTKKDNPKMPISKNTDPSPTPVPVFSKITVPKRAVRFATD